MQIIEQAESQIDLIATAENIMLLAEELDFRWVRKKIRQAKGKRLGNGFEDIRGVWENSDHPLISLYVEYEKWLEELKKTKNIPLRADFLKLAILANAIRLVKGLKGYEKLIDRLKRREEFESAAFEAEIAASYVARGFDVEFVEEGNERSPDLVVSAEGKNFWVECKCRDALSDRDKKIFGIWAEVEKSISHYFRTNRLNFSVIIIAKSDPDSDDIKRLRELLNNLVTPIDGSKFLTFETDKFEILIQKIAESEEIIQAEGFGVRPPVSLDQVFMGAEMKHESDGQNFVRNPFFIGFKSNSPPDWVTGIVNTFRTAVGQIPKGGPGVIWIRVPDISWNSDKISPLERASQLLQKQLFGASNRRVNSVFLMKREFEESVKNEVPYLAYRPSIVRLDHQNPQFEL